MASDNNESYLAASHVISLIAKLLDTKRNVYAESFNKIFATCKVEMVKSLDLNQHIINLGKAGEENDGCYIVHSYMTNKNLGGTKVTVDQILSDYDAIQEYNSWYEKKQLKNLESNNTKNNKSVLISMPIENEYTESSIGSGREKSDEAVGQNKNYIREYSPAKGHAASSSSFLNPIVHDKLEIDENMITHDFDSFLTMKKTNSFKVSSINDDFKGKKSRFSVMKIIPDDVRGKARLRANEVISNTFLEHENKIDESMFKISEGLQNETVEMNVEFEIINLMHYIFTLANCRT